MEIRRTHNSIPYSERPSPGAYQSNGQAFVTLAITMVVREEFNSVWAGKPDGIDRAVPMGRASQYASADVATQAGGVSNDSWN